MKRLFIFGVILSIVFLAAIPDAQAKKALGKWYKDATYDFKIRIPAEWEPESYSTGIDNLIGKWRGEKVRFNFKGRTYFFYSYARIIWLKTKSRIAVTKAHEDEGKKNDSDKKKKLDDAARRKLSQSRSSKIVARDLEQWLQHCTSYSGVRILEKKEIMMGKRPAIEYEFLTKTDLDMDTKHYAVCVKVSEFDDMVIMYSMLEKEYKNWRSLFRKSVKTLKLDWPEPKVEKKSRRSKATAGNKKQESDAPTLDTLVTKSGKIVEGKVRHEEESYVIEWEEVAIKVPSAMVSDVQYGNPQAYVPQSEDEKEKLAQGYVKYKNRWMPKRRYETERDRDMKKRKLEMEEIKKHSNPANPWKAERPCFTVETTTSKELLDHYTELLDAHIANYEKHLGIKVSKELRKYKPTLRVFKDRDEYSRFSKSYSSAGYFNAGDNTLNIYHDFEDPEYSEKVLVHEGTHVLNYYTNTKFLMSRTRRPMWVEEGSAEFFGSSKITRDKKGKIKLIPGQILGNRLILVNEWIETGKVKNLRDSLTTLSYVGDDYCYWWSTFHFLMTTPKYATKFRKFYQNLYALKGVKKVNIGSYFGVSPEDSVQYLEKCLGIKNWQSLQADWEAFVQQNVSEVGGRGWMVLGIDRWAEARTYKLDKTMEYSDSDRKKMANKYYGESIDALDKAIDDLGYKTASVYSWRSRVYKSMKKYKESLEDIQRAVSLDPLNAKYYYNRAVLQFKDGQKEMARRDMKIAKGLDPTNILYPAILKEMQQGVFVDLDIN